jgi:hypothetical protein
MVGDKRNHDRVVQEYPAPKWDQPQENAWGSESISPQDEYANAVALGQDIIDWNMQNGGLITPDSENPRTKGSGSKSKKDKEPPKKVKDARKALGYFALQRPNPF